jgi:Fe-S-cluster containining protein
MAGRSEGFTEMTLAEIYKQVPDVHCRGKCQKFCGPIAMSTIERNAIRDRVGEAMQTVEMAPGAHFVTNTNCLECPMLKDGRCSIYDIRPLVCRLFGAVKAMRCPHGCKPKRWLKEGEVSKLMHAITEL